jgi:hypothetical protein
MSFVHTEENGSRYNKIPVLKYTYILIIFLKLLENLQSEMPVPNCIARNITKKLCFLHLPLSPNNNDEFICFVVNLFFCMNSKLGGVNPIWTNYMSPLTVLIPPPPINMTGVWWEPPPFLSFGGHGCLFKLGYDHCFVSTQNCCHMDLWSAWSVLTSIDINSPFIM